MSYLRRQSQLNKYASKHLATLLMGTALTLTGCATYGDTSPSVEYYTPSSSLEQRRNIEDPKHSAYAFQHIDEYYPVAIVKAHPKSGDTLNVGKTVSDINITFSDQTLTLDEALAATETNAFLIMKDGEIIYEKYFNNSNQGSRFIGWSISKSVTSILVGLAVEDGSIRSIDDKLTDYLPEYKNTAFAQSSIRNLLEMRAGTSYLEQAYGDKPSTVNILANRSLFEQTHRFTDISGVDITSIHAPGEVFNYSTLTAAILGRVVEAASGKTLAEYMSDRLWKPAGMRSDAYWMLDGEPGIGDEKAGGGVNATLRDYARLGQIMLDGGKWNGKQIVPADWVAESTVHTRSDPVLPNAPRGYGYQWWTLMGTDVYEALGIHGQTISIDPKTQTVIVKMSYWPTRGGMKYSMMNNQLMQGVRDAVSD